MKIYFGRVNTAKTTLAFAAPEKTLSLRKLWPVSCQNWPGLWMQNSELNSCWPVPCPELLPPVVICTSYTQKVGVFGTWANFMLGHDIINLHGAYWGFSLTILFPTIEDLYVSLIYDSYSQHLGWAVSHIVLICLLFLHRPRTSSHGTLCYFPKQLFPL